MEKEGVQLINIEQVVAKKAPAAYKKIPNFVFNLLKKTIHQDELNHLILTHKDKDGVAFMQAMVEEFKLNLEIVNENNIPDEGKFTFVSNHPLGGLDGICLSSVLGAKYNGHVRYLVNDLLMFIPNLRSIFIPVNKHGAQAKKAADLINSTYASDNQVITFPSGMVSRSMEGKIVDMEWKKSFIQKSIEYQRDIIPVYFEAKNSGMFYSLANLRKKLGIKLNYEMILLPDEMFKNTGNTFRIHFGKPIPWQHFDESKTQKQWAAWVKEIVYNLSK